MTERRTNAEVCRESYAKHREKRLAAKREEWARDPEKMRARQRAQYAKNREARVQYAREYRQRNREALAIKALERYARNREARLAQRKVYRKKNYAKIYARIQKWRKENPERELLYHAKRLLNEQVGIPIRDIPNDLAEAKAEQIKIHRMLRDKGGDQRS